MNQIDLELTEDLSETLSVALEEEFGHIAQSNLIT